MQIEKSKLNYWSPLPPKRGGFIYREQHMNALNKYFNVHPIDMTGFFHNLGVFIATILLSPLMLLSNFINRKTTIDYIEYDFASYKSFLFFPNILFIKMLLGNIVIFRLHEDYKNKSYGWMIRLYDNFWLWLCADIIFVHTYEHAKLLWRVNRRIATVLLSGLELKKHRSKPTKNTLIIPGFINLWKGHDILLNALLEVRKKIPKVKLIIAGKIHDSEFFASLNRDMLYSDLIDNVELHTDYLDKKKMNALLSRATLAVLPYRRINFSAVLLDCIDWEIPTIVSNIPQFRELCPDLPNFGEPSEGVLFECDGDHDDCWCYAPSHSLAEKIIELLKDGRKLMQVKKSMKDLKKEYDVKKVAKEEAKILYAELKGEGHKMRHWT